jgi:hypothetical protein
MSAGSFWVLFGFAGSDGSGEVQTTLIGADEAIVLCIPKICASLRIAKIRHP